MQKSCDLYVGTQGNTNTYHFMRETCNAHKILLMKYMYGEKYARASTSKSIISKPPVQADGVMDSITYILSGPVLSRKLLVMIPFNR